MHTKKLIVVAGYTKQNYILQLRKFCAEFDAQLVCAYTRKAVTENKEKYLKKFDALFNLTNPDDVISLEARATDVLLVTCTQERDMEAYIQALYLCKKITNNQVGLYTTVIDKKECKDRLATTHPELVPKVTKINESFFEKPDSLVYPQVVKPSGLAGSILVKIVNSPQELQSHYRSFSQTIESIGAKMYGKKVTVIAEEYISGPQYSVNTYIDKNQHITFCPITRVVTPQEIGIDDSYSALQYTTSEISETMFAELRTAVQTIVAEFNIRETSAHFDSVYSNGQWKFFEVGLRIGGNRQELYALSHNMNHFENDVRNRLGLLVSIPEQKNTVCIVQKAAQKSGTLRKISYLREVTTEKAPLIQEHKMAKIGSFVAPLALGGGTITRHFVYGSDQKTVIDDCLKLFNSLTFDIVDTKYQI